MKMDKLGFSRIYIQIPSCLKASWSILDCYTELIRRWGQHSYHAPPLGPSTGYPRTMPLPASPPTLVSCPSPPTFVPCPRHLYNHLQPHISYQKVNLSLPNKANRLMNVAVKNNSGKCSELIKAKWINLKCLKIKIYQLPGIKKAD